MNDSVLKAAVYSVIAALLVGFITVIRGYGNLETHLEWVTQEQVKVINRLDKIAADMAETKSNRYTDSDAARDKDNFTRDQDRLHKQIDRLERNLNEQSKMIGNIVVQIARRHSEYDAQPREGLPKDRQTQEYDYEF